MHCQCVNISQTKHAISNLIETAPNAYIRATVNDVSATVDDVKHTLEATRGDVLASSYPIK